MKVQILFGGFLRELFAPALLQVFGPRLSHYTVELRSSGRSVSVSPTRVQRTCMQLVGREAAGRSAGVTTGHEEAVRRALRALHDRIYIELVQTSLRVLICLESSARAVFLLRLVVNRRKGFVKIDVVLPIIARTSTWC